MIIFTKNEEEHLEHLRSTLEWLQKVDKDKTCEVWSFHYKGISPSPEKS